MLCLNLSSLGASRCVYPRIAVDHFAALSQKQTAAILERVSSAPHYAVVRKLARATSDAERAVPFDRFDHRYWTYRKLIDVRLLDRVDAIWRYAGGVLTELYDRAVGEEFGRDA